MNVAERPPVCSECGGRCALNVHIIATVMAGYGGHGGWNKYLTVAAATLSTTILFEKLHHILIDSLDAASYTSFRLLV